MDPCARGQELAGGVQRYPPKPGKKKHFLLFETDTVVPVEFFNLFCAHQQPMRCTERRTQASELTLTAFLSSGGGETCRVNSSWYLVLHNVIDAAAAGSGVATVPLLL